MHRIALPVLAASLAGMAHGQLAAGVSLNFEANQPASGVNSANWNSLSTDASQDFDFGADVSLVDVISASTAMTKAYRFTGVAGDADCPNWNGIFGDGVATTWEFWLKPDDNGNAAQVIWESGGGGTGHAIWYEVGTPSDNSGTIHFTIDGGTGAQIETVSAVIDTSDFRHVVCVYNESGSGAIDVMQIWVDGVIIDDNLSATTGDAAGNDNDNTGIDDFCGGDNGGLGSTFNSLAETATDGAYDGDIAVFRVWGVKALTPTEIAGNYSYGTQFHPTFAVDAASDTDADDRWEDTVAGNPSGVEYLLDQDVGEEVTRVTIAGSNTSLTHAYEFVGGSGQESNERGALLVNTGTTTRVGAEDIGWDTSDVAVEMWIRPDTITPAATNGIILWETGGLSGLGLVINNNEIIFSHDDDDLGSFISYNLSTDPSVLLLGPATSEFIHVVGVFEPTKDNLELYINGQSVGTVVVTDNDWSGADDSALGTRGGVNTGGFDNGSPNYDSYDGEVALMNIYTVVVPSASGIQNTFNDLSGPDILAPIVTQENPADDSVNAYIGTNLIAGFSEPVALTGNGSITIKNLNDGSGLSDVTITLPDASVTVSNDQLTIDPASNLAPGTGYAIRISNDALQDLAGNNFGGISDDVSWNFTTAAADPTAPVITSYDPADEAANVTTNSTLTATFDDNLIIGSGNIRINEVGGSTLQTIDVADGSQVSIVNNTLTITPGTPLQPATNIAIQIDAGAVKNLNDLPFGGILNNTTWNFSIVSDAVFVSTSNSSGNDTWSQAGNWDIGTPPSGAITATISSGLTATSEAVPSTYSGGLTLESNARLDLRESGGLNALGSGAITMNAGSQLTLFHNSPDNLTIANDITFAGNAAIDNSGNGTDNETRFLTGTLSGPGQLTYSMRRGNTLNIDGNNASWSGGFIGNCTDILSSNYPNGIEPGVDGAFGTGDVTLNAAVRLLIPGTTTDTISDTATLTLNGVARNGHKIVINSDETIGSLVKDGFTYPAGTYGKIGTPASVDHEVAWIDGNAVLTVASGPADSTPPTVVITDNSANGELFQSQQPTITYTLTFDEPIATSVTTANFDSIGNATVTIDSVNQTADNILQVQVTASTTGTVLLRALDTATFSDFSGNALNGPICDDNIVTMRDLSSLNSELGVLDLTANGGVNPATGNLWQVGDTYRLAFVSSGTIQATSNDVATYNTFIQNTANASSLGLGGATWKAIVSAAGDGGSIAAINAKTNTSTDPVVNGTGEAIFLMDGTSVFVNNYADLWDSSIDTQLDLTEEGTLRPNDTVLWGSWTGTWTGTNGNGTADQALGNGGNVTLGLAREGLTQHWVRRSNGDPSNAIAMYGLSDPLTIGGTIPPTAYEAWVADYPGLGGSVLPTDNPDGDNLSNQLEFAFGTNPTVSDSTSLTWDGSILTRGTPTVFQNFEVGGGVNFKARFIRRIDHGTSGSYSYAWQFNNDLTPATWESSADTPPWYVAPTCIAIDGDYELVEVPYPFFLSTWKKARFFRVEITPEP